MSLSITLATNCKSNCLIIFCSTTFAAVVLSACDYSQITKLFSEDVTVTQIICTFSCTFRKPARQLWDQIFSLHIAKTMLTLSHTHTHTFCFQPHPVLTSSVQQWNARINSLMCALNDYFIAITQKNKQTLRRRSLNPLSKPLLKKNKQAMQTQHIL